MEQVRFRGKVRIIRKGTERVDSGMDEDAGKQAAAAIKDRDQQEADCDGKNDLAQVTHNIHAAAVEQVSHIVFSYHFLLCSRVNYTLAAWESVRTSQPLLS